MALFPSDVLSRLIKIGTALSAEINLDRLLEMIVFEARHFTNADGGTLYIMSDDEKELQFAIIQNDSLRIRMGGTGEKISWPPVSLETADHLPNHANVSAYAALTGKVVAIEDVHHATGFNFEGTRAFDDLTGYRSVSMLVVPLKNHENAIIGVLQLINALDPITGFVCPFSSQAQQITESLASQAAIALSNNLLIRNLKDLLGSFIKTIAMAIDEKSPYTGGHFRRVANLTMTVAERTNAAKVGPYADRFLSENEIEELRIASWLHDVGKITTPEYLVNKSARLETIFDRIELIRARFEILKRDQEIAALNTILAEFRKNEGHASRNENDPKVPVPYEKFLPLIESINRGGEPVPPEAVVQLKTLTDVKWKENGTWKALLSEDELRCLTTSQGTLTDEERAIIRSHALITHNMLSGLPFPKKLRNVPFIASSHHEKLDGTGYPHGLKKKQLPLQSRILAIADIFEALTATDRPYKKGNTLTGAIRIMRRMVSDGHIDRDLFDLFLQEKIHLEYAARELSDWQRDMPDT